ncbi:MAG: helix-hairpin-helix domain-containing protein [Gemmatimonadales bacterium]|nr:helix-hairpin-helix domain-containing protein [Gemmatimonadales bacterium]
MAGRWSPFVAGIALMVAVSAPATAQDPLDLNKATREQLVAHPGIGQAFADKIIAARPFKMRSELVARGIMPATQYLKIKKGLTPTAEDAAAEAAAVKAADPGPPRDAEGRLNLNSASRDDLAAIPGVGQLYADKIVAGRPFKTLDEVVSRRIMPSTAFKEIRHKLFIQ